MPDITPFSGTHTKADIPAWIDKVVEIRSGKFGETLVVIIANDDHGVVMLDHWLERAGKRIE